MRIFERIEGEIAFIFHGRVAAEIGDQRVRELMQDNENIQPIKTTTKVRMFIFLPQTPQFLFRSHRPGNPCRVRDKFL